MAAELRWLRDELMRRRHLSIKKQGLWLQRLVGGYFNHHAMPTNIGSYICSCSPTPS